MNKETIKEAVKEAMQEEIKEFYIERKQHFEDHQFIGKFRKDLDTGKKGTIWTMGALMAGAIVWAITRWISIIKGGG